MISPLLFLLSTTLQPTWIPLIGLSDLIPGGDGSMMKLLRTLFDSLSSAIRGTVDEFFDVAIDVFFTVQNPYGHQEAFNAWMDSFELALAIFPIMIILGLLSMPFADEQKTTLWRQGLRAVGVIVLIALSRPLIGFGVDLANIMTHALMPAGGDLFNLVEPLTLIKNQIGGGIGFVVIAFFYFSLVAIAVLVTLVLLQVRNFMIYVVFIMSPLLAVFWYADWGILENVNEMANKFARMGIYSLLVGPIAAIVYRTLLVIGLSGFGDGFSGADHVSAMWSELVMAILLPFLLIATIWKLISWAGEPLGVGNAITGALVAAGAALSAGVGAVAGGGAAGAAGSVAKGASSAISGSGGGGGGGGGGGSSGPSISPSSSGSGSSGSSVASTGGTLSDVVNNDSGTVSASGSSTSGNPSASSGGSSSGNTGMPGGGPPASASGTDSGSSSPKGYVEGAKDRASGWASRNYNQMKQSLSDTASQTKEQFNPANIQRQKAQKHREAAQSLQQDKEQFDDAIDHRNGEIDLNQAHESGALDADPVESTADMNEVGHFSYTGKDGETHEQNTHEIKGDKFDEPIDENLQTAQEYEQKADKIGERVSKHGPRAKKSLQNASKIAKKGYQVQAAAGKAFLKEGIRGTIGAHAPYLMQGSGYGDGEGSMGRGRGGGGAEGVPPAQQSAEGSEEGWSRPEHSISPEQAEEHSSMLSESGERFDLDRPGEFQPTGGSTREGVAQHGKMVDPDTGDELTSVEIGEDADFSLSKGEDVQLSNVGMTETEGGEPRVFADENSRKFEENEKRTDDIIQNPDMGSGEEATLKNGTLREAPGETPEGIEGQYLYESQNGEIVPVNAKDEEMDQHLQERVGERGDISGEIERKHGLSPDAHNTHQGNHEYNTLALSSNNEAEADAEDIGDTPSDSGNPSTTNASTRDSDSDPPTESSQTASAQSNHEHGMTTNTEGKNSGNTSESNPGNNQKKVSPEQLAQADNAQTDLPYKTSPEGNWAFEDTWDEGEIEQDMYDGSDANADEMIAARGVFHEADENGNIKEDGASVGYVRFGSKHGLSDSSGSPAPEINGERRDPEDGEVLQFDDNSGVKTRQWATDEGFNFSDSRVQEATGVEHGGNEGAVTTYRNGEEIQADPESQYMQVVPDDDSSLSSVERPDTSASSSEGSATGGVEGPATGGAKEATTGGVESPPTGDKSVDVENGEPQANTTSVQGDTKIENGQVPRTDETGTHVSHTDIDGETADVEGTVGTDILGNPTLEDEDSSVPLADETQTGAPELGSGQLEGVSEGDSISANDATIHTGDETDTVALTESSEVDSKDEHSGGISVDFGTADTDAGEDTVDYTNSESRAESDNEGGSQSSESNSGSGVDLFGNTGQNSPDTPASDEANEVHQDRSAESESASEGGAESSPEGGSDHTGRNETETKTGTHEGEKSERSEDSNQDEGPTTSHTAGADQDINPETASEEEVVESSEGSTEADDGGSASESNDNWTVVSSESGGEESTEPGSGGPESTNGGSSTDFENAESDRVDVDTGTENDSAEAGDVETTTRETTEGEAETGDHNTGGRGHNDIEDRTEAIEDNNTEINNEGSEPTNEGKAETETSSETTVEHTQKTTQEGGEYDSGTFESGDTELGDREDGDYDSGEVEERESRDRGSETTASHSSGAEQNIDPETASENEVVEESEEPTESESESESESEGEGEGEGDDEDGSIGSTDQNDDDPGGGGSGNLSSGGEDSEAPTTSSGASNTATHGDGGSSQPESGAESGSGNEAATTEAHSGSEGSERPTTESAIDAEIDHSNTETLPRQDGETTILDVEEREKLHDELSDEHSEEAVEEVTNLLDTRKKSSEFYPNQVAKSEKIGNEALGTDHPIRQEIEAEDETGIRETVDPEVSEDEAGVYRDLVAESNEFVEENVEDENGEATVHRGMSHRGTGITSALIDDPDAESVELPDQEQSIAYSTEEDVAEHFAESSNVPIVAERDVSDEDVLAVDALGYKSDGPENVTDFENQSEGEIHVLGQEEMKTDNLRFAGNENESPAEVIKNATENPEEASHDDHDKMDFLVRRMNMDGEAPETEEGAERLKQWGEHVNENPEAVPDEELTLHSVESTLEESEVDIDHNIREEGEEGEEGEGGGSESNDGAELL